MTIIVIDRNKPPRHQTFHKVHKVKIAGMPDGCNTKDPKDDLGPNPAWFIRAPHSGCKATSENKLDRHMVFRKGVL
jgi:hypothetical protein